MKVRGEDMDEKKLLSEENSNVFASYISELYERTINSREIIVWFRNEEMFDTKNYFWCNTYMGDKLGIKRNEQGLIKTKDYYNTFVLDDEGQSMIEELKKASVLIKNDQSISKTQYIVKLQNQESKEIFYIDFILEIFERYPDGRIKTWGGNGIDISDTYKKRKQIEYLASHDLMTNMLNRTYLFQNVKKLWSNCYRNKQHISFIMIDVDDFKKYNDTYGHIEGDKILRTVGEAIHNSISRSLDIVGRYGGEEFLVALPNTTVEGAYNVAELMRNNVSRLQISTSDTVPTKFLSISLGVYGMIPTKEVSLEEGIEWADKAMYQAKNSGKNRTIIHK